MIQPDTKVLSLFSGIGGLDIGARAVGLETTLAVDLDQEALALLGNHLECPTLAADLSAADPQSVAEVAGIQPADTLVIIGGPPCTGFSHAGFWLDRKRNGADPAVGLLGHFGRFVQDLEPKIWVLENVPGLTFKTYAEQLQAFTSSMRSLGYSVSGEILNAADFGVPQRRRRFFMVGIADDQEFVYPDPVFAPAEHRTAGWAFGGLEEHENPTEADEQLTGRYAPLLPKIPPGDNYLFFTAEREHPSPLFEYRSRYWSFLKKLSPDEPSNTVPATRVTNNGPFHWENRHLRIREMARLQGFPDSIEFRPTTEHRRYIGNAVPPLLAAVILAAVMDQTSVSADAPKRSLLEQAFDPAATPEEISVTLAE